MKLNLNFYSNQILLFILLFFFLYILIFHIVKMNYMNAEKNKKVAQNNNNILLDHTIYYNETLENEEIDINENE